MPTELLKLKEKPWWISVLSIVAVLFGLLTLKSGGTIIFGGEAAKQAAGDYVPFVLYFNFLAGFAYIAAGAGFQLGKTWSKWLAGAIAGGTIIVFAGMGIHILFGGAFETRTVGAMTFRSLFWISAIVLSWRYLSGDRMKR